MDISRYTADPSVTVGYGSTLLHVRPYFVNNFPGSFSKNSQISNLMKIRTVDAEFFHADGQTDRCNEANSLFSQFCERTLKIIENRCSGPYTKHKS